MSQEVFEMIQGMDLKAIETQLALQCAPIITGLKVANLLIVPDENVEKVKKILKNTGISYYILIHTKEKATLLLYKSKQIEEYLNQTEIKERFLAFGYPDIILEHILPIFQARYVGYMEKVEEFPHEMGLLLGYPVEDVDGFIQHEGKNFLYAGYWKVYKNPLQKKELFRRFELAKERLIQMLSSGMSMNEIIAWYGSYESVAIL